MTAAPSAPAAASTALDASGAADAAPVTGKDQLVAYVAGGCRPAAEWRIGTEHEKFPYDLKTLRPLTYDGSPGIRALLEGMTRFGWEAKREAGNTVALGHPQRGASVSLEPAGQLELSGAQLESVHQTCGEVQEHLEQVKEVSDEIGAGMLGLGFDPKWGRDDVDWMPKGRYRIMRDYMPRRGGHGLDMMTRSCTVQVNLDYESEADMVAKMRVGLALQPVATALFANSPFTGGRPNGYLSYRSFVWTDTDPDRCGMLPFVFDEGFGFEAWVDYVLDVPMYFVYRDGRYIDVSGHSFRDFMAGRLAGFEGEAPVMKDWIDQLTMPFPEVRLKRFIEMRGADGGPWRRLCALPALWVGLLYDPVALDEAWQLCRDWSEEEREGLRAAVPLTALKTPFRSGTMQDLARETVAIARRGLARRGRRNAFGDDEAFYLAELEEIAESGITPAERLLEAFEGEWGGDIDRVYAAESY